MAYRPDITGQRIVSDSGDVVVIWDIAQAQLVVSQYRALTPSPCNSLNQSRERLAAAIEAALALAADLRARFGLEAA